MPVSSTATYVDNKDNNVIAQGVPVSSAVGNPPNGWCCMAIAYRKANGAFQGKTIYLGPASYASFIAWLGHDPMISPDIERGPP